MSRKCWYHLMAIFAQAVIFEQISAAVTLTDQPHQGNIYAYSGLILTVPCRATSAGPPPRNVSTTLYLNSAPFNVYFPPSRYGAQTDDNGAIIGFVVIGVLAQDNGTLFKCSVDRGDGMLLWSSEGTLIVQDGAPGPVPDLIQTHKTIHCVTVEWSPAPSSPDSPVILYTVTMATAQGVALPECNVSADDTLQCTLCNLSSSSVYSVTVAALNTYGYGVMPSSITVQTASPIVPRPPSNVQAILVTSSDNSTAIRISWTPPLVDYDLMSPLVAWVVFYGTDASLPSNITSPPDATSALIQHVQMGVVYAVGVAAMNSAGHSDVTYVPYSIYIPYISSMPPTTSSQMTGPTGGLPIQSNNHSLNTGIIVIIAIVCVGIFVIFIILAAIFCVVWKKRHISTIDIRRLEGGSPGSVEKFAAVVPLKSIDISPVLGRHVIGTPNSSETSSTTNNSPSLCGDTSKEGSRV